MGMFLRRPCLSRPSMGMEVTLWWTIKWWILRVLTTVMILDMTKTLSKVLMRVLWLTSIGLMDDVSEECSKLPLADIGFS